MIRKERERGGRKIGRCVFAGFLGRFSLSSSFGSCRVTCYSSLVFLRRRPILRSFNTTQYLTLRVKQGVSRHLALRVPRPLYPYPPLLSLKSVLLISSFLRCCPNKSSQSATHACLLIGRETFQDFPQFGAQRSIKASLPPPTPPRS